MVSARTTEASSRSARTASARALSYADESASADWKIAGLVVTPTIEYSAIRFSSSPEARS